MIHIKEGVVFHHDTFSHPEMGRLIHQAQSLSPPGYEITITSACDGNHKDGSKHYKGTAIDFRTKDFPAAASVNVWGKRLQNRLGDEYFILIEDTHLHAQWNGLEGI